VLGTQMERHIAKRLGLPCAVISAPVHVQDFPARHAPQMGFEGANVLFDTWVHPLMMGLEEHLLACSAATSSSMRTPRRRISAAAPRLPPCRRRRRSRSRRDRGPAGQLAPDAEQELRKIRSSCAPRPGATPRPMREPGPALITLETLYDAKAHFSSSPAVPAMNVVIVTMDSHLASAAERANALARSLPACA
jgi:light-independent protochlorophyllide reductase subunit B